MKHLLGFVIFLLLSSNCYAQRLSNEALAIQFYRNGEYEKAAELFEVLYNNAIDNDSYYENLLNSYFRLQDYSKAEKLINRQKKRFPTRSIYKADLGHLYKQSDQIQKANTEFEKVISEMRADAFDISDLGQYFYRIGEQEFAVKAFLQGRKLLNNKLMYVFDVSKLYILQNKKAEYVEEMLNLLEENEAYLEQAKNSFSTNLEGIEEYDILKNSLLRRIQAQPQNTAYSELLIWQFIQTKEFSMAITQTIAIDRRLNENGERLMQLAQICRTNEAYDEALRAYNYVISKGNSSPYFISARIEKLNTASQKVTAGNYTNAELAEIEKDYWALLDEFGKNEQTAFAMRDLANLKAKYLNKVDDAIVLLETILAMPRVTPRFLAQCKMDLADAYLLSGDVWEPILLLGQVDKAFRDDPIGQEARFKNAKISYYNGDFEWAKAQLDVLKGSTSQLWANDALNLSLLISDNRGPDTTFDALKVYASAELLITQNNFEAAISRLDTISILYPSNSLADDILMAKAKIHLHKREYEKAEKALTEVFENYAFELWADDALFLLAELYEEKLNEPAKAKQLYERLLFDFPGSLYVVEVRKRFRNLRGDVLN